MLVLKTAGLAAWWFYYQVYTAATEEYDGANWATSPGSLRNCKMLYFMEDVV
jgi:hypothetical protein